MLCGPEIMMRFTVQALLDRGFDAGDVYLSMERNMKCGIGFCGHCQMGAAFVCKDGPVFAYPDIEKLMRIRGI
jgi:NAD(P)H-flavin reductase